MINDKSIIQLQKEKIYVAAICDILDSLGFCQQAMHQRLRPLLPDWETCGFIGRARTFRWMETDYVIEGDPYGKEIEAMDSLNPGDVIVHSTDWSGTNAPWGELMTTVAKRLGAVACICDSQVRDCIKIIKMNFPVYYSGIRPLDSKGRARVMAYDVPVRCGEVLVNNNDLIVADFDGIVVIPKKIEKKVIGLAIEKIQKEDLSREAILKGWSLRKTYNHFGVL
jgi:regulator of RNase E activity RraA